MNKRLKNFQQSTANWRETLRRNKRRSYIVMSTFVLIYAALGMLIDLYIQSGIYIEATLSQIFIALITFQLTPVATLITLSVAAISLWVTFLWHDKLMLLGSEYREITPETASNLSEKQLYNTVEEMKVAAGLQFTPRVYIIEAEYMNAFASGYSEKSAMVAITRGLLLKLNRSELQAVMAHELSHIRHMDIKLTLMASVLSNLILIVIDVMFYGVLFGGGRRSNGNGRGGNWLVLVVIILRYLLPVVTVLLMLFLSRTREYMADAGCVELMRDNEPLASALMKIQGDHAQHQEEYAEDYNNTPHESVRREAYISDPIKAGIESRNSLSDLFSTHPSIVDRLKALGFNMKTKSGE